MLSLLLILISKSWGGRVVSPALSSASAVSICIPFLVYLLPCLLARLFVFFASNSPCYDQSSPCLHKTLLM